jgi:catechol 2,3-dioxygenase-like lactoylglutathione lyase family enzyme
MLSPILACRDVDASIAFYTEKLGFEHAWSMPPGANGKTDFACVRFAGAEILLGVIAGFVDQADVDKRGTGIQIYIEVPHDAGIEALYSTAKMGQVNITDAIRDRDWGERTFAFKDPDGYHYLMAVRIAKTETNQ